MNIRNLKELIKLASNIETVLLGCYFKKIYRKDCLLSKYDFETLTIKKSMTHAKLKPSEINDEKVKKLTLSKDCISAIPASQSELFDSFSPIFCKTLTTLNINFVMQQQHLEYFINLLPFFVSLKRLSLQGYDWTELSSQASLMVNHVINSSNLLKSIKIESFWWEENKILDLVSNIQLKDKKLTINDMIFLYNFCIELGIISVALLDLRENQIFSSSIDMILELLKFVHPENILLHDTGFDKIRKDQMDRFIETAYSIGTRISY